MTKSWSDLEDIKQNDYDSYNNLLILDANNISYRFLHRANYNSYGDEFQRTVQSLGKSYKAKKTVVCFDFGKSVYRMAMHDQYKGTRKKPESEEDKIHYEAFFAILNELPEILSEEVLKFRGIEADDLLAYLAVNKAKNYDHTWIVSSDKDLIQLVDDNVSIFNIFSRKEITKNSLFEELELTPSEFMLSRIIEGDSGDNIIGIEGIGPKRAQGLAKQYKELPSLLKALPISGKSKYINNLNAGKETLIINEKLIDLKKYHLAAIEAVDNSEEILETLENI